MEHAFIHSKPGTLPEHIITYDDFQKIFLQHAEPTSVALAAVKDLDMQAQLLNTATNAAQQKTLETNDECQNISTDLENHGINVVEAMETVDVSFKSFKELANRTKDLELQQVISIYI